MVAEDFEVDYILQEDRDFLNAITGLAFLSVSIIMMFLVMSFVGGISVGVVSILMLLVILVGFSLIETWSDNYGKNNKDL